MKQREPRNVELCTRLELGHTGRTRTSGRRPYRTAFSFLSLLTILAKPVRVGGYVAAVDPLGRTISIVDAHRDGKHFVVRADEKLTAFLELERAVCIGLLTEQI